MVSQLCVRLRAVAILRSLRSSYKLVQDLMSPTMAVAAPLCTMDTKVILRVCKYIIEDGKASINKANNGGYTPLAYATGNNKTAIAAAYLKSNGGTM